MNKQYSEEEKEEIVKAFKAFMKKVVKHSAIDYARKVKSNKYREIVYSDLVDNKMSLSVFDDGIFLFEKESGFEKIEDVVNKSSHKKAISILNDREKYILSLYAKGYSVERIAKKMNTTANSIYVTKNNIKKKVNKKIKEIEDGE